MFDEEKIDREINMMIEQTIDKNKPVYDIQANLGNLIKSLLWDYKIIVIRIRSFRIAYKGELETKFLNKLYKSRDRVLGAIRDLISLFENREIIDKIVNDINDDNLVYHMTLKDQLIDVPPSYIDDLTHQIDLWFRERQIQEGKLVEEDIE